MGKKFDASVLDLSPTALNLYNECPRCLYLERHRTPETIPLVKRPRGIFPSLPGGMDRVAKALHDRHREAGTVPTYLSDALPGRLFPNTQLLRQWRAWRTAPKVTMAHEGVTVSFGGAIDDLWHHPDNTVSALDTKTKGDEPKDDGSQYYQTQLDGYELMLQEQGFDVCGKGYLVYFWPIAQEDVTLAMGAVVYELAVSAERARALIHEVAEMLLSGRIPDPGPACEYCPYADNRMGAVHGHLRAETVTA